MTNKKSLTTAMEGRRSEVGRVEEATAKWVHCTGEVQVIGAGEAIVDVLFPVFFVEKPRYSSGAELFPGDSVAYGTFPTYSATIIAWDQRFRGDGTVIFVGATIGIVSTGPADQVLNVFWHMEGVGLRAPSTGDDST